MRKKINININIKIFGWWKSRRKEKEKEEKYLEKGNIWSRKDRKNGEGK